MVAGFANRNVDFESADFALARYNPDGTLDTSFGKGGKVTTDFDGSEDIARALAIQTDGKIVAVGLYVKGSDFAFAIARYTSSGKLDQTFGQGGKVLTHFSFGASNAESRFVAIQSDRKILVGGMVYHSSTGVDFALARYKPDGSLDSSFGADGMVTTNVSFDYDSAYAAVIQSTGKIVVGGVTEFYDPTAPTLHFMLVRYLPDGTVDTTFGPDGTGIVITQFGQNSETLHDLAVAPDDSLVAAGSINSPSGFDPDFIDQFVVAKFTAEGILNQSFGKRGKVTTAFGPDAGGDAYTVLLQPDGRIVAAGDAGPNGGHADFGLARYNADGTLDDSFGQNGLVLTAISSAPDSANGLAMQSNGKLIAVGTGGVNQDFAVARYETGLVVTKALNLSTRADVGVGDNVLIGGFIITGADPEEVLLRAIGPSLSLGNTPTLADPVLELHKPDGTIVTNDNWKDAQRAAIIATGIPPKNDRESAIVASLDPGAYTAIVHGKNGGSGVALVELYDLGGVSGTQLANVSSRSVVQTGDNVMIGGFIIGGMDNATVLVRGLGPSLNDMNVANALADPTLQIVNANGAEIAFNDNWKDSQQAEIEAAQLAPTSDLEAAAILDLSPGNYTAVLRGHGNATGVGLVEAYNLP